MRSFSYLFWISSGLFTLHQIVEKWWSIPYVHAYLDDVLAPSIVLGLALFFFQRVFPGDPSYSHPRNFLIIFVIWYSILFEVIFPAIDGRHYADIWDLFAYSLGTWIFHKWGNEPLKEDFG